MKRLLVSVKLNPFILHEYKRAQRCKTRHMDRKSHHLRMSTYACKHVSGAWGRGVVYLVGEERTHPLGEGETHLEVGNYAHGLAKDRGGLEQMLGGHTSISIGRGVILNISASGGRC